MDSSSNAVMKSNQKMTIADNASLTFFTNPLYLNILQRKNICNVKNNTEEIKFYRKRIVSLFKDMMKETDEVNVNKEIKEIHTMFVNATIRYFEVTDKKDIIQGQHQIGNANISNANISNANISNANISNANISNANISNANISNTIDETLSPEDILNTLGDSDLLTINEANDIMMRKNIAVASLDNYVISKQDNSVNETRIIPIKMNIDLKTNDLKFKGVSPKKVKKNNNL